MKTYMFPGQGSQYRGMGATLFDEYPELTQLADSILGYSIRELCMDDPQQQLHQTGYTQPALYVVNALSYRQKLKETGSYPDFVAGHSLGEYNALESAGAIRFEDGLQLVKKRGELMSQAAKGAMAAVLGPTEQDIRDILEKNGLTGIDIANINSPSQTILSGLVEDINQAQDCFVGGSVKFIPLNTSGAFHSRYMAPAQAEFERYLQGFNFVQLTIPVISNVQAKPYHQQQIAANLARQITHPVRWSESMQYLISQGVLDFVELGPGTVLTKLIQTIREQAISAPAAAKPSPAVTTPETLSTAAYTHDRGQATDALNKKIHDWNQSHPIGTPVIVKGYQGIMATKSNAVILFGHRAAIYLEGYNGYFALDEVSPV
ncbi:MAG: ACP S-malonyltransferase [Methylovulum sp.]|nr:ACP S-malonyltransferase [Methylovulum sp.]